MAKTLELGKQKIQQICDAIKNESIEPAKKEAEKILAEAQARAREIIQNAQQQAQDLHQNARSEIEQERHIFQSSLKQGAKLTIETLKQQIEQTLFHHELQNVVEQSLCDPQLIAKVIDAIVASIVKDGLSANLTAVVSKTISPKELNVFLTDRTLKKLKDQTVELGDFTGGAKVRLIDKRITIDISGNAIMEMLAKYAPNFRKEIFNVSK